MKYIFTLYFGIFSSLLISAQNKTYYVSVSGNDNNNGQTKTTAWASVAKVNNTAFLPGDHIYFEGNKVFSGTIDISNSANASSANPILFGSFGGGTATINAGSSIGFWAYNKGGIILRNLKFTGDPSTNGADGISFFKDDAATDAGNLELDSLEVSGFGGVGITLGTSVTIGFNNVRITQCKVHDNGSAGIFTYGNGDAYSNSDFYIAHCKAYNNLGVPDPENNTGNGILVSGVDHATVEYSEAYNNGKNNIKKTGGPVGIWVYNANHTTIQYCESHHNFAGSLADGGGFDIDGGSQNCTIQYCYSHDNEGAGFALFEYGSSNPYTNNKIRYNISQNDARKNSYGALSFWGGDKAITNSAVYNNTIYVDNTTGIADGTPCAVRVISGNLSNILVANNIFYVRGGILISSPNVAAVKSQIEFKSNDYFSAAYTSFNWGGNSHNSLSDWSAATGQESGASGNTGLSLDPALFAPGTGANLQPAERNDLSTVEGYKIQPGSPMINAGMAMPNAGAHDFFGLPTPNDQYFDIGASEYGLAPPSVPGPNISINLTGSVMPDHALLIWQISNELSLSRYEVLESTDSINFNVIGNVLANGNTNYNFPDYTFASGQPRYYRIRGVDNLGNVVLSGILKLEYSAIMSVHAYFKEGTGLIITLNNTDQQPINIGIYDANGKKLLFKKAALSKGNNSLMISEAQQWVKGVYIIHLSFGIEISLKFIR